MLRASTFSSYIIGHLENQTAKIDVSSYNMTVDAFKNAYWALLNSRPDLFYVSGGFSYYHSGSKHEEVFGSGFGRQEIPRLFAVEEKERHCKQHKQHHHGKEKSCKELSHSFR